MKKIISLLIGLTFLLLKGQCIAQETEWKNLIDVYNQQFNQQKYAEAQIAAGQLLVFAKQQFTKENPRYANAYLLYGNVLEYQKEYTLALAYYDSSLTYYSKDFQEDNVNTSIVRHLMGNCLLGMNKFDDAEKYIRQALYIYHYLKKETSYVVESYASLALVKESQEQLDLALLQIENGISMAEKIQVEDMELLSRIYNTKGNILFRMESYSEAESAAKKALDKSTKGEVWKEYTDANNTLGKIAMETRNTKEALLHFRKATATLPRISGDTRNSYAVISFNNIGNCFLHMNNPDSALHYLKKSETILATVDQDQFPFEYYWTKKHLGKTYFLLKDYPRSTSCYRSTLQACARYSFFTTEYRSEMLAKLSEVYEQQTQKDSANLCYRELEQLVSVDDGKLYVKFLNSRMRGDSLTKENQHTAAMKEYTKILSLAQKFTADHQHAYVGLSHYKLASTALKLKKTDNAIQESQKALTVLEKNIGETGNYTLKTLLLLSSCYRASGDLKKAEEYSSQYQERVTKANQLK